MRYLNVPVIFAAVMLGACSFAGTQPSIVQSAQTIQQTSSAETPGNEAILLVSLDNGSIIMQKIHSAADVCFKVNSGSATTCLTQGAAVIDPQSNTVIGYEMIEEKIELIAKTH